jgi:hypothetical protein
MIVLKGQSGKHLLASRFSAFDPNCDIGAIKARKKSPGAVPGAVVCWRDQ